MILPIAEAARILGLSRPSLYDRAFKAEGHRGKVVDLLKEIVRIREYERDQGRLEAQASIEASRKAGLLDETSCKQILCDIARAGKGLASLQAAKTILDSLKADELPDMEVSIRWDDSAMVESVSDLLCGTCRDRIRAHEAGAITGGVEHDE